jgi:hypothetical protein
MIRKNSSGSSMHPRTRFAVALAFSFIPFATTYADGKALPRAHAHNDYEHPRPLLDALDHGFCNVEADVYLTPQGLLVAHDLKDAKSDRTLESLYLKPLRQRVKANGSFVLAKDVPFTLLIDIKSDAEPTYAAIHTLLEKYAGILSVTRNGHYQPGPVTVIISGNRPIETMARQTVRYAGIDGRSDDLTTSASLAPDLMPWISAKWGDKNAVTNFQWNGDGPIPPAERQRLRDYVRTAHDQHRKVRFWATPEKSELWRELLDADVDLLGVDQLDELQAFLKDR